MHTVRAAVQAHRFDPVYYLHGADDFLKSGAISNLLDAAIDPGTRDFNCDIRRAADLDAEALDSLLNTPPMLAERRAVVLHDVTALRKTAKAVLDGYLAHPASYTLLLLLSPAGTQPDAALSRKATSLEFAELTPDRVHKWIGHHARTVLDVGITDDAANLLVLAVGSDLQLLAAELDKCASHMLGAHQRITADAALASDLVAATAVVSDDDPAIDVSDMIIDTETVSAVVGVRRGETVADLLDAVGERDASRAVSLVSHVLSQPKASAVHTVMMLTTQVLALTFGRSLIDGGAPGSSLTKEYFAFLKETGAFTGRSWGDAVSAWTRVTKRWNRESCEAALALLLEADMALKETRVSNDEQIMLSLVLALCTTGRHCVASVGRTA